MPQISRERLAAKLQQIPEGAREPYLRQLKERGYTWETRAAQEPSAVRQFLEFAKEQGPQAVGAQIGSTMGTPFGVPGRVAGATVGGAGGKAWGITSDYLSGQRDPAEDTASENAKRIGLAGLAEGGAEAGLVGLGRLKPLGVKVGAGLAKVAANVDEKLGAAAFNDPGILSRALPRKEVGAGYDAFERYTGLQNLEQQLVAQNRATAGTTELERMVLAPANKVFRGQAVDPQELYTGSQAASRLKLMAKYGEPQAQMAAPSAAIGQGKETVEKALEKTYPEYGNLRKEYFESKVKEAFSPLLPKNKGGSTNVLRPALALREALLAAGRGSLAATGVGLPLVSPKAWGALIRLLPSLGKAGKAGARVGAGVAGDTVAEELP